MEKRRKGEIGESKQWKQRAGFRDGIFSLLALVAMLLRFDQLMIENANVDSIANLKSSVLMFTRPRVMIHALCSENASLFC